MNFTPDPVAFSVFGLDIRWYAILVCGGMILAALIGILRAPRHEIDRDGMLDIILISIVVGVIGARAWYVFFNRDIYDTFLDMINIRAGGLAIHGGLIFGALAAVIVCLIKKYHPVEFLDLAFPCVALGQAIGRWGNFFNQEAYGTHTNLPWAIVINGDTVHPTFLYESIWCFILFIILLIVDRHRRYRGQTFLLYGVLYSIERFVVEQFRTDSLLAGPIKLVKALREAAYDPSGIDGVTHIGKLLIYPFRTAQGVSIVVAVICFILMHILGYIADRKEDAEYDYDDDDEYYDDDFYDDDELSRRERRKLEKEQRKLEKEQKKLEKEQKKLGKGNKLAEAEAADEFSEDKPLEGSPASMSEGEGTEEQYEAFPEEMPYEMNEEFYDGDDPAVAREEYTEMPVDSESDYADETSGYADGYADETSGYADGYADETSGYAGGYVDETSGYAGGYTDDPSEYDDGYASGYSEDDENYADESAALGHDDKSVNTEAGYADKVGKFEGGYAGTTPELEKGYPEEPEREWYDTEDEPEDGVMAKLREKYSLK